MDEDNEPAPIFEFSGSDPATLEAVVEFSKSQMEPQVRQKFERMVTDATQNPETFVAYTLMRLSEIAQSMNNIGYTLQVNGLMKLDKKMRTHQ